MIPFIAALFLAIPPASAQIVSVPAASLGSGGWWPTEHAHLYSFDIDPTSANPRINLIERYNVVSASKGELWHPSAVLFFNDIRLISPIGSGQNVVARLYRNDPLTGKYGYSGEFSVPYKNRGVASWTRIKNTDSFFYGSRRLGLHLVWMDPATLLPQTEKHVDVLNPYQNEEDVTESLLTTFPAVNSHTLAINFFFSEIDGVGIEVLNVNLKTAEAEVMYHATPDKFLSGRLEGIVPGHIYALNDGKHVLIQKDNVLLILRWNDATYELQKVWSYIAPNSVKIDSLALNPVQSLLAFAETQNSRTSAGSELVSGKLTLLQLEHLGNDLNIKKVYEDPWTDQTRYGGIQFVDDFHFLTIEQKMSRWYTPSSSEWILQKWDEIFQALLMQTSTPNTNLSEEIIPLSQ